MGRLRHDEMTAHPTPEPEAHFDVVVVGSGFGGSVMTQRLAEAGMSVCLLERGKAYPPGSFARSPWEIGAQLLGPERGPPGALQRLVVPRPRRHRRERARGRIARLLERRDQEGREHVRPGRARDLAGDVRGSRAPLRAARGDARRSAVSVRAGPGEARPGPRAVRPHLQDATRCSVAAERLGLEWHLPKLAVAFSANGEPHGRASRSSASPRTSTDACG